MQIAILADLGSITSPAIRNLRLGRVPHDEWPWVYLPDDSTFVEFELSWNLMAFEIPDRSRRSLPFLPTPANLRQDVGLGHADAQAWHKRLVFQYKQGVVSPLTIPGRERQLGRTEVVVLRASIPNRPEC